MSKVFDRGDIVRVPLNPVVGHESQGDMHPVLVLTPKEFNRLGSTWIAPITQGGDYARVAGFAVNLMGSGTQTQGVVLSSGVRNLDLAARGAKFVEKAPEEVVEEVVARIVAILGN